MKLDTLQINSPLGSLELKTDGNAIIALNFVFGEQSKTASSHPILIEASAQLNLYFKNKLSEFKLPLKPKGSSFQIKVWDHLNKIPFGSIQTYAQIAWELDTAPRAIGGACAKNPIPIIIPCHRVTASSGKTGGFSAGSGVKTKLQLLKHELN